MPLDKRDQERSGIDGGALKFYDKGGNVTAIIVEDSDDPTKTLTLDADGNEIEIAVATGEDYKDNATKAADDVWEEFADGWEFAPDAN